ncbi:MAG: NAD-dependent deacylase, partial [Burkholderiales bacterium]|nr:NAD-dependent deacylase [Anaerolineae bacterium]
MTTPNLIQKAAALIRDSQNITVLTGAGVSRESGIPTFRDALDGLWARFNPQELATASAFMANPKLVWD